VASNRDAQSRQGTSVCIAVCVQRVAHEIVGAAPHLQRLSVGAAQSKGSISFDVKIISVACAPDARHPGIVMLCCTPTRKTASRIEVPATQRPSRCALRVTLPDLHARTYVYPPSTVLDDALSEWRNDVGLRSLTQRCSNPSSAHRRDVPGGPDRRLSGRDEGGYAGR
jgi:hypothetical protein